MSIPESSSTDPRGPEAPPPGPAVGPEPTSPPPASPRAGRVWAFALLGAIVAGLGAFAFGEAVPPPFEPTPNMIRQMGQLVNMPKRPDVQAAERKNAIVTFSIYGGALGLALGLAGGLARGSARRALLGGAAGLVLGAGAGAAGPAGVVPLYHRQSDLDRDAVTKDLTVPLLTHAGIWAAVGLAAGAALAIGSGARGRSASVVLSGLVGGALGAAVYEVTAALLSPEGRTYQPVATSWEPRLVAATACPILIAALVAFALVAPARSARKPRPVPEVVP